MFIESGHDWTYALKLCDFPFINQLGESGGSEGEAESMMEKKAAHSSGRKYVPPKIAAVHYGTVLCLIVFIFVKTKKYLSLNYAPRENIFILGNDQDCHNM